MRFITLAVIVASIAVYAEDPSDPDHVTIDAAPKLTSSNSARMTWIPNWLKVHRWGENIREWDPLIRSRFEWRDPQSFRNQEFIAGSHVRFGFCIHRFFFFIICV
jgi:hypothetical protein